MTSGSSDFWMVTLVLQYVLSSFGMNGDIRRCITVIQLNIKQACLLSNIRNDMSNEVQIAIFWPHYPHYSITQPL